MIHLLVAVGLCNLFCRVVCGRNINSPFVRDAFIRPYMGDVLVVILVYCFVRMFITRPLRWLPLWIFLFACCIETLQYLQLVTLLGLQNCTLARVVLGTSFSWWDIVCYAVGCLSFAFYQTVNGK